MTVRPRRLTWQTRRCNVLCVGVMVYQCSWKVCLLKDSTCASCMMGYHYICSDLLHKNWTVVDGRWIRMTWRPNKLVYTISWPSSSEVFAFGTPKDCGVFRADHRLSGITVTSRECLSEYQVKPAVFERVRSSLRRRADSNIDMHWNHVERLL